MRKLFLNTIQKISFENSLLLSRIHQNTDMISLIYDIIDHVYFTTKYV